MICKVIVSCTNKNVDKLYDYNIPSFLDDIIEVGQRVLVSFNNRNVDAYVIMISDKSDYKNLKDVIDIIDLEPILNDEILSLIYPLAKNYVTSLYSIIELFIPKLLISNVKRVLYLNDNNNLDDELKGLFKNNKLILSKSNSKYYRRLKTAIRNNDVVLKYEYLNKVNLKKELVVNYKDNYLGNSNNALTLLNYIKENGPIKISDLKLLDIYKDSYLDTLKRNNTLDIKEITSYRRPYIIKEDTENIILNNQQIKAINKVDLNCYDKYLLYGVTNSGKTEVYFELIAKTLALGKSVILLVPEIALTSQLAMRAYARFKDNVAIIHSNLSLGERYDEYRRLKNGEARICIGPRSAIFSTVSNLGLIIIDEEHSLSYIANEGVLYNAISVATLRAKENDIPIILGSATPRIEDYYNALNNNYKLLELPFRAIDVEKPDISIVDMRQELVNKNYSMISSKLKDAIDDRLNKKEQVLIYLNKRGRASAVMCRSCGNVILCPNCNVALTYHNNNLLKCHLCNYETHNPHKCPKCGSDKIRYVGTGTEKIEDELKSLFKDSRILRLDSDSINRTNSYEKNYEDFINHKYDILVGTQMITKGLDFNDVTLVGVVNADLAFYHPSYDAIFEGYALLEQAIGRSGRHKKGEAIIQTYNPLSKTFDALVHGGYKEFYHNEIKRREKLNNPPFINLKYIKFISNDRLKALSLARKFVDDLDTLDIILLGPSEDINFKIGENYHFIVHIKYKNDKILDVIYNYIKNINDNNVVIKVGDM